jgi:hypothetical protein
VVNEELVFIQKKESKQSVEEYENLLKRLFEALDKNKIAKNRRGL